MEAIKFFLLCFVVFGGFISNLKASIVDFDEVWQQRAAEAKKAADEGYHPSPHHVTNQINHLVHMTLEKNSTRRGLTAPSRGPCVATNPIDSCWRCDPNWDTNREKLANCALGFARGTTGGKGGKIYVVNDSSDSDMLNPKPGTLRHAVIQTEPLWIIFAEDMTIKLQQELIMASHKTIDGRGRMVAIAGGGGFMLQFVKNIIISNIKVHDTKPTPGGQIRDSLTHFGQRGQSEGDAITVFGSTNVWIDHVSMWNCADGLVDVVAGSTAVTISNCHMTRHNDVMLFGHNDNNKEDSKMQVTVAFNHFGKGLIQRMPRVRFGLVHVLNNDYTHWLMYAIGGSSNPTILSHGNRFVGPPNPNAKQVTKREAPESVWKNWLWKSEEDLFENGAFFVPSGNPDSVFATKDMIPPKHGKFVGELTRFAGHLHCYKNTPC